MSREELVASIQRQVDDAIRAHRRELLMAQIAFEALTPDQQRDAQLRNWERLWEAK